MPYQNKHQSYQPNLDAGLGLIFRLNALWNKADYAALEGDFDKWNFVLDAIYRNLLYRHNMDVKYEIDDKGKPVSIISIDLLKEDKLIFNWFKHKIRQLKVNRMRAIRYKKKALYHQSLEGLYTVLGQKDSWLRKFMQERGLYLREVEFNPANAMWGG